MKKKIIYFSLLVFAVVTSSCKKDIEAVQFKSTEDLLLQKISRILDTKGGITIASRESYSKSLKKMVANYQIDGSFESNPFEEIEVGDIILEPLQATRTDILTNQYVTTKAYSQDQINNVFGRKISVNYHKSKNSVALRSAVSIETPEQLQLNVPGMGSTATSFRNVPITWTAGNSSDNVYILISFQPESILNPQFRNLSRIDKFISVPDNGSYTIANDNFAGIPQGAYIIIAVARGNTALAAGMVTGTDRTSITAITTATLAGTIGGGGGGTGCGGDICIEQTQ